ncbi:sulfite exporter TauE/SafE family protein, partial [Psychrobacter alimentarius]
LLTAKIWLYGLVLGLGAVIGNIIGKRFLAGMSVSQFRIMLLILMVVSGLIMIIRNIDILF